MPVGDGNALLSDGAAGGVVDCDVPEGVCGVEAGGGLCDGGEGRRWWRVIVTVGNDEFDFIYQSTAVGAPRAAHAQADN